MKNVEKHSWNHYVDLDGNAVQEIKFWQDNIEDLNGFAFKVDLSMLDIHHEVITDASGIGLFGYRFFSNEYEVVLRCALSLREMERDSTFRELLALDKIYTGKDVIKFENSNLSYHLKYSLYIQWQK